MNPTTPNAARLTLGGKHFFNKDAFRLPDLTGHIR
jgi:hypothetical protein